MTSLLLSQPIIWRSHQTKEKKSLSAWSNNLWCRKIVLRDKTDSRGGSRKRDLPLKNILPCDSKSLLTLFLNITDEKEPQEHLDPHYKQCSKVAMYLH